MFDSVAELLAANRLDGATEEPFPNDGWSGSRLTALRHGANRFVLKRTSWATDWIVRATADRELREAWAAGGPLDLPDGVVAPYPGVARDAGGAALLMPDLSGQLLSWAEGAPPIGRDALDVVIRRLATLHAVEWWPTGGSPPWCALDRRLLLLTRPSADRYRSEGLPVGDRFVAGWDAFDRCAPPAARELVGRLCADVGPLMDALGHLPAAGLHGDLKLANVAVLPHGAIALVDWQMTLRAPVALELGWFLVSNVALLPEPPDEVLARYRAAADGTLLGDWDAHVDLAWIVGLLLRGWRKGLDAEAGVGTGWGTTGASDLVWWCERAVAAANRRL